MVGRGKADSLTMTRPSGKFKLWQSNKQQHPISKHQSMLPMINGQVQRHANGIVIRAKQLRQPPLLNNGVANNLYLGAASLTLNPTSQQQTKKKSLKEAIHETSLVDNTQKELNDAARKQS